jgi:hypothetical protein
MKQEGLAASGILEICPTLKSNGLPSGYILHGAIRRLVTRARRVLRCAVPKFRIA